MNRRALTTFVIGLLLVGMLSVGLWAYQDRRDSRITAVKATLTATTYGVGVEYSGVLVEQKVEKGQKVQRGELLGVIKSGSLMERLREAKLKPQDLPYTINERSEIELRASNPGLVKDVRFTAGSFVPANQAIFEIIDTERYYVTSVFDLSDMHLKQLSEQKVVDLYLQSGAKQTTRIRSIDIKDEGPKRITTIESVPTAELNKQSIKLGEPVTTTLILREEDSLSHITTWVKAQFSKVQGLLQQ